MESESTRKRYIIWGIIFACVLGTLAHFFYEWSGNNRFVGYLCPVNESTWEHMKLVYMPLLCYFFLMKKRMERVFSVYTFTALSGCIVGTWLVPALCFFYRGLLGFGVSWIDIATFFMSVILVFLLEGHFLHRMKNKPCYVGTIIVILLNIIQLFAFIYFTYHPLDYGIFQVLKQ